MKPTHLLALCAILVTSTLSADDQIYNLSGTRTASGTITGMSATEVVINTSAGERRFPANQIRHIVYDQDTGESRTARTRALNGQLEEALAAYQKLNPAEFKQGYVQADLEYYKAYCMAKLALAGGGDKAEAGRALIFFVQNNNRSYHLFDAAELIGDVTTAMGRFDMAEEWYGKLAAAPWPEVQMKGLVLQADALISQEKFQEASSKYDEVIGQPQTDAASNRQKLFAQLGKAYCAARLGRPDEGVQIAEKIIRENDSQDGELFARAYNTLGICHREAKRYKEALHAFLHTDVLFFSDPNAHAEALYYLVDLWEKNQKSARALEARSLLKSRYAGTVWASK